jgi:hypothetical protein
MNTYNLKAADFLLGVEESWDSYFEVIVNFIEQDPINDYSYYLFVDKAANRSFYLSPRYLGQKTEDVFMEKRIVVNVSKIDPVENQAENRLPKAYATGSLQLSKVDR